jgi:hypothetical protein
MEPAPATSRSAAWRRLAVDALAALAIGVAAWWASCALVPPAGAALGFGTQWQVMSERPFDFYGQLPHRWLAPLLAWATGLGGASWVFFTRLLSVLLLAMVYLTCRRRGALAIDAALVVAAVAVISPNQMYKQVWVGYPDALAYALCFGKLLLARRPIAFWALFFLNLNNHELAVFLLPWLWYLRHEAGGSRKIDVVGASAALLAYGAFYLLVRAKAKALFTFDYFASHPLFPGGTFVVLALVLVHYTLAFGPQLAVLSWCVHSPAYRSERRQFLLVLAAIVGIFCIAFDWTRHCHLLVVPLVLAAQRFLQAGRRLLFVLLVAVGAVAMAFVWPWSMQIAIVTPMYDAALTSGVVQVREVDGMLDFTFGPLRTAVFGWLPMVATRLLLVLAVLAAIWGVGFVLARWRKRSGATPAAGAVASPR